MAAGAGRAATASWTRWTSPRIVLLCAACVAVAYPLIARARTLESAAPEDALSLRPREIVGTAAAVAATATPASAPADSSRERRPSASAAASVTRQEAASPSGTAAATSPAPPPPSPSAAATPSPAPPPSLSSSPAPSASASPPAASPSSSAPPPPPPASGSGGRGCVFMVDSRPLTADYGAYHALAAAAGYSYARAHGYAYRYVQPLPLNVSALAALPGAGPEVVAQVAARAGAGSKEGAAVWHPLLHQLRAAPWLRVLPAWALATSGDYDWVLYLDSDAHVRNASMSLAEFVASRSSGPGRPPWKGKYGVPPQDAAAIFPPNYPWCCEGMPMTSYVLFRGTGAGGASSAALFAGWHNTDAAEFNFKHAYEQNALWAAKRHFKSVISVLDESVSGEDAGPGGFVSHWGSNVAGERAPRMRAQLARQGVGSEAAFAAVVSEMLAAPGVVWRPDPLALAAEVAAAPAPGGRVPFQTLDEEYWLK